MYTRWVRGFTGVCVSFFKYKPLSQMAKENLQEQQNIQFRFCKNKHDSPYCITTADDQNYSDEKEREIKPLSTKSFAMMPTGQQETTKKFY